MKTSYLDNHTTNDVKPEMLSGVETGNRIPHDEYNVRGIPHVRAYIKDDIFMTEQYNTQFSQGCWIKKKIKKRKEKKLKFKEK